MSLITKQYTEREASSSLQKSYNAPIGSGISNAFQIRVSSSPLSFEHPALNETSHIEYIVPKRPMGRSPKVTVAYVGFYDFGSLKMPDIALDITPGNTPLGGRKRECLLMAGLDGVFDPMNLSKRTYRLDNCRVSNRVDRLKVFLKDIDQFLPAPGRQGIRNSITEDTPPQNPFFQQKGPRSESQTSNEESERSSAATEPASNTQSSFSQLITSLEPASFKDDDDDDAEDDESSSWSDTTSDDDGSHPASQASSPLQARLLLRASLHKSNLFSDESHLVSPMDWAPTFVTAGGPSAGASASNPPPSGLNSGGGGRDSRDSKLPRKRGRPLGSTSDNDEEETDARAPKKRQEVAPNQFFACPFVKNDPIRHRDCYRFSLTRVRDVKQHLKRRHTHIYCPRCSMRFSEKDKLDVHLRTDNCENGPPPLVEINESQKSQLDRRVSSRMSREEQWYSVYAILFPGHRRPESPYSDRTLITQEALEEFLQNRGSAILLENLESTGAISWNISAGEDRGRVLLDAFLAVLDGFISADSVHKSLPTDSGIGTQDCSSETNKSTENRIESSSQVTETLNASEESVPAPDTANLEVSFSIDTTGQMPNFSSEALPNVYFNDYFGPQGSLESGDTAEDFLLDSLETEFDAIATAPSDPIIWFEDPFP